MIHPLIRMAKIIRPTTTRETLQELRLLIDDIEKEFLRERGYVCHITEDGVTLWNKLGNSVPNLAQWEAVKLEEGKP